MQISFLRAGRSQLSCRLAAVLALLLPLGLSGCIGVGYSSSGGWFIWPPVGIILLIVIVLMVMRRR